MSGPLSPEQVAAFERDGYIVVPRLLTPPEVALLRKTARQDQAMQSAANELKDKAGHGARLSLWNESRDDAYGLVARSPRVVDAMEQLLGGEVYHYHSKMSMKEPLVGGAWEWHQDYGYWYHNACLFPYMASCFLAVDPCTRENGCMQVLRGSHHMGRIEHGKYGEQAGADPERTAAAAEVMDLVYVEMDPGDALFFHCNTLHRSDQNKSPQPRWSLICCYNAARNNPYQEIGHSSYIKLEKVPDNALLKLAAATP